MVHIDPAQYDAAAEDFAGHMEKQAYNVLYERPAIRSLIGDVRGLQVLDVACGAGSLSAEMHAAGANVVGSDASNEMLRLARERLNAVTFIQQDCSQPFRWADDQSFDLIAMSLAYHYLNDHAVFLAEMHRVLRPSGALVISTHHPTDDWRRLGGSYFATELNTDNWKAINQDVTAWRMPLGMVTDQFHQAGFMIEQLVEPRPSSTIAEQKPETFAKLEHCPAFILFRLRKASSHGN